MLAVLLVVMLVVVLLSCCCHCLRLLCCLVANTAAAATIGTSLPPPPPLVGMEVDACCTNANSSPATSLQIKRQKNQEQKYTMALGGHQTQIKMQQPTKNTWAQLGRDET
jgi:hypothetical protein